jgi:hypothetical protein
MEEVYSSSKAAMAFPFIFLLPDPNVFILKKED